MSGKLASALNRESSPAEASLEAAPLDLRKYSLKREIILYNMWNRHGLVTENPWPSKANEILTAEGRYSWMNQAIWAYKNYAESVFNKYIARQKISADSKADPDFMRELRREFNYKLRFRIDQLFSELPEIEQRAIISFSTPKYYSEILRGARNFEFRYTSARNLIERCNNIFLGLTLHAYNKFRKSS